MLVLDALGMSDIDFTGSRALSQVLDTCDRQHITVGGQAGGHARESFGRSGLADRIGDSHFYPSVNEAVTGLTAGPPLPT